ncbi:MAG: AAA family ATPase, partial [Pseudomonadales bacterium]|nr:AAA family ATPase [Pseudomonadales bacterium]
GNAELPGNVISILEKLSVRNQKTVLNEQRIYESLESQFHIKKDMIDRNITLKRPDILAFFNQNLIGQAKACEVLTDTVLGIKAQITPPSKPLNTMLFIGPTGVGKTEAVKLLANYLFDRPECLVRIDMNEYVDDNSVDRLIGSQHHPQGILTEQVRYNGSCVLLLDEIEKAHPRVHDLLLQLLDDGRLTDALGNTTDFTQCVIVMTSNIGAQEASTEMGFAPQPLENASTYLKALEQFFRPEMINRINNIVVFDALQQDSMQFLARLHLSKLLQRDGFTRRKTILNVDEECLTTLANQSYNPKLGARALKRNLEKTITQLTGKLLSEITSSDPIILNVALADGQPVTTITQLVYQAVIPNPFQFDSDQVDLEEYRNLLLRLEDSDNALTTLTGETNEKTKYAAWSLSAEIRDIKEPLQRFLWETEDRLKTSTIKGGFSLRSSRAIALSKWKGIKVDTSALFAHNDMRDYLHDLHKKSGEAFQEDLHSRLQLTGETQQLTFASKCLADRGIDQGTLLIMPLMTEGDTQQVDHLDRYVASAVDAVGSIEHRKKGKSGVTLSISGCGIHELLEYESGVHLFIEHHSMQVPVLLHYLRSVDPDEIASAMSTLRNQSELQVLRLYYRNDPTAEMYSITDLRLGMSIEVPTTPADLNILLYPCYSNAYTKTNAKANKGTNLCQ